MSVPTENQHRILLALGSGSAMLTGTKRTVEPLVRRGWVTTDHGYSWVRITPEGLRALASSVERYGLPDLKPRYDTKVCTDCGREWNPRCKCGSRSWYYEEREVVHA